MKTISIITLLAFVALVATPKAQADNETRALVGGLIGGLIIGSVLADEDVDTSINVGYYSDSHRNGYYNWVTVKVWVQGYHERRYDNCGNRYRAWVPGHYTFTKRKVWVEGNRRYDHRDQYRHNDRHSDYNRRHSDRGESRRRSERVRHY